MSQLETPDEIAIWQLLCRYSHLVDRGDMSDVVDLFHPEGSLLFPPNPPAKGQQAVRQGYDDWFRSSREPTVWLRHQITTPLIQIDGDRATSECYLTADFLLRKKNRVQALVGRYKDELVRQDDQWMFWQREIIIEARLDFGEPR